MAPFFSASRASVPLQCRDHELDRLAFLANPMQRHDPPVFHEKPNYAGVELADMPHFKKTVAKRFGQRLTMILAIAKLGQTRDYCSEVVRISHFQIFQEILHRAGSRLCFIELYRKIHGSATSNLMYITSDFISSSA